MSVFEEVFAISSSNGKIREFFEFANDLHKTLECTNKDCGIFKFLKPIEEALPDGRCCFYKSMCEIHKYFCKHV